MHEPSLEQVFESLFDWCRRRDFAGYDPFDALNSQIFQSTPFQNSPTARLIWTQLSKRSPLNLRRLALVQPQRNPKGIAVFALAALANYRRSQTREAETETRELLDNLWEVRIQGFNGAAWYIRLNWKR